MDDDSSSIPVIAGFAGALAAVVWLPRVYHYQARNRRLTEEGLEENAASTVSTAMHAAMTACNSFALVYTGFLFCVCGYRFLRYKVRDDASFAPNGIQADEDSFIGFFRAAFWTQTVYMCYIVARQSSVFVFFLDWGGVSFWRQVIVANEWNRLQAQRSTSLELTLVWMCFLLVGLGLDTNGVATPGLSGTVDDAPFSAVLRFANTAWWWVLAVGAQRAWKFLVYERFLSEPPWQRFIDLCSVASVSVLVLDEPLHGYYLHCRSYKHADCALEEMLKQLDQDARGLVRGGRGLDAPGAPQDCQSFELFTSVFFRRQIDKVYASLRRQQSKIPPNRRGPDIEGTEDTTSLARLEISSFLKSFVDQSPPPPSHPGLHRVIREATWIERVVLHSVPMDVRTRESRCVFRPHSEEAFLSATFLGIELDLTVHDILTFHVADMAFGYNTAISILCTYLMHLARSWARGAMGRTNTSKKSLLDERFLLESNA